MPGFAPTGAPPRFLERIRQGVLSAMARPGSKPPECAIIRALVAQAGWPLRRVVLEIPVRTGWARLYANGSTSCL